jgi:predicted Zn-ribbon and HTH transcriptional regulator
MKIEVKVLECKRCGYDWMPRQKDVRQCPSCRSVLWDVERTEKRIKKEA